MKTVVTTSRLTAVQRQRKLKKILVTAPLVARQVNTKHGW
jgi:hypothetical protein